MKIEKKLVALSIFAVMVGVASIVPLYFSLSAKDETPKPWFSIDIPYAYFETRDGTINYSNPMGDTLNTTGHAVVSNRIGYVLGLTFNANLKGEADDARYEYYQINITSDKGPIETENFQVGTSSNVTYRPDFQFSQSQMFNTSKFDPHLGGGGGVFIANWTTGLSRLWPEGSSGSGTVGSSGASRVVSTLREAQTVTVTVYRVGWVSFKGNSTLVTYTNNAVVCQIQLEKYGNGWLYNNFIPAERLAQIDPGKPLKTDPKTGEYAPNV